MCVELPLHVVIRIFDIAHLIPKRVIIVGNLTLKVLHISLLSCTKVLIGKVCRLILLILAHEVSFNLGGKVLQSLHDLDFLLLKQRNIFRLLICCILQFCSDGFLSRQQFVDILLVFDLERLLLAFERARDHMEFSDLLVGLTKFREQYHYSEDGYRQKSSQDS